MGTALQLVDDKNRVSIPAKFRDAVIANTDPGDLKSGPSVMIGQHPESPCLIAFDRSWIENEMATAATENAGGSRFNTLRAIAGGAEPVGFDSTGRAVLVNWMKDEVGIKKHAFFYGSINHFEIWDPATLLAADDASVLPVVKNACRRIMAEKGLA
ncbi:MAG: division/cell wall cluster transcriptional repressor MraZ [Sphingomonas sp.]|uniref:division/cell wall cluster transcriptional repressor MraZ n=1 Tax=Sphingomonas sp. TaxID=28214 RepID=UPI001ACE593F|nr:division/cell wall cluster transcriptional repressor MraZ [Sphingomonas sp.]MBN8808335.1 division/cell wall cluster transcriptional repressor MraZ [Sphingomonas sp.]